VTLELVPVTFTEAAAFVGMHHRHNRPPIGHKFSLGVAIDGTLVGVAIVGRPVARHFDDGRTLEVNRTATDGTSNANSKLSTAPAGTPPRPSAIADSSPTHRATRRVRHCVAPGGALSPSGHRDLAGAHRRDHATTTAKRGCPGRCGKPYDPQVLHSIQQSKEQHQ
jgi:hypothetical protein